MAQYMLSCFNKFNACLLHFRVYAKNAALVIEGMEQSGQLMHIMGNAVYRALFGCRGNKFRIFAQFLISSISAGSVSKV